MNDWRPPPGAAEQFSREISKLVGLPQLIRPAIRGTTGHLVRNVSTGRVLPCCWSDCERAGSDRIQLQVKHERPRWRTPDGRQEMLVYIFCSDEHKEHYRKAFNIAA